MSTLKLLIVDDEPFIRAGASRILRDFTVGYPFMEEDFSFDILEAETGEKAIEIIDNQKVDIVLLDNKLPGIEGIEVLEYIKNKEYDIAVMMITSYASLDLAVKATNNGAFSFVPKPFTPDELKTSIESITKSLYLKRMTLEMKEEGKQVRFQFLSVLSHELKSPINAIEGYMNIIKQKQLGNNVDDYLVMINRSLDRLNGMRNLIMDLLDLTRMESGRKHRNLKELDIVEIAEHVVNTVQPLAIQKNVEVNLKAEDKVVFKADTNEIEIILNNFISNAVKYNVENGKVFIDIKRENNQIIISVKDTGIGMKEEDLALLFQDFVRIKNEKTKFISGSGLGLSIAKKMVELYNGRIEVESTPDVGSVFTIFMPC
ncbi:MAG: hybrid sensor histidine kinase/response regulator [Bacteroidales bacterium]|jgi:signal transduction histidine kinase|nr:response regulator [Bacteroidales bacterium]MCK9500097.1 response regulator [Bacteroidales bacterium]MDY0313650.1 response regulator [Bacteroidales bacterium]NLB86224.1 hybrid sensor histidine kinase/response regulator [Bacteroidales bacterium]